jgi:hypothetical protein
MNRDFDNRSEKSSKVFIVVTIVVLVIALLWTTGLIRWEESPKAGSEKTVVVAEDSKHEQGTDFMVSENEWRALKEEVENLRQEVKHLKSGNAKPETTNKMQAKKTSETIPTKTENESVTHDVGAITLASYNHDWVQSEARVSLKNNTRHIVTQVTGRMIYYDMNGNMMDYQDFTKSVTIEPNMVKNFSLRGYGYSEGYAYYKSDVKMSMPNRKYKVKFELKSYKTK